MSTEKHVLPTYTPIDEAEASDSNSRHGRLLKRVLLMIVLAGAGLVMNALVTGNFHALRNLDLASMDWSERWDVARHCMSGKHPHQSDQIHWKPCFENKEMMCATFAVPTDYDDPSVGTTYLALSKIPAICPEHDSADASAGHKHKHKHKHGKDHHKSCSLGTVMLNYGGPNVPGRQASFTFGRKIHKDIGGRFDVISWDPRGIGRTVPAVNCHGSADAAIAFRANTVAEEMFDVPSDPFSPEGTYSLVEQQRQALGLWQAQAELCGKNVGADVLKYMGTTTLIKDIARLSDVIDGPGSLINFHGGSYGTVVMNYLVNMLPERVGKVVAHGVANPVDWTLKHYETYELLGELLTDAESTYDWFLQDCHHAGPKKCGLAKADDKSFEDIKKRVDDYLAHLYANPLSAPDANRPGLLKSGMIRYKLFQVLQMPDVWDAFARELDAAMHGNGTAIRNRIAPPLPSHVKPEKDGFVPVAQDDLTRLAVSCADAPRYQPGEEFPTAEGMVAALQKVLKDVSPRFGATVNLDEQHGGCQFWPQSDKPVHRFTGPFNASLANPVLVVSNVGDPITPALSGRDMSALWGNMSTHVVQEAPGHSYLAYATDCYKKILKDYFEKGVVPDGDEVFCKVERRQSNFPPRGDLSW